MMISMLASLNLKQIGTVSDYITRFETSSRLEIVYDEDPLMELFIAGLRQEIQAELEWWRVIGRWRANSLGELMRLALEVEEELGLQDESDEGDDHEMGENDDEDDDEEDVAEVHGVRGDSDEEDGVDDEEDDGDDGEEEEDCVEVMCLGKLDQEAVVEQMGLEQAHKPITKNKLEIKQLQMATSVPADTTTLRRPPLKPPPPRCVTVASTTVGNEISSKSLISATDGDEISSKLTVLVTEKLQPVIVVGCKMESGGKRRRSDAVVSTDYDNDDPARILVDALIENNVLELLVQNLQRLSDVDFDPDETTAGYNTLTTIENLIEVKPSVAELVCDRTKLLRWLLGKIKIYFCLRTGYYDEARNVALSSRASNQFAPLLTESINTGGMVPPEIAAAASEEFEKMLRMGDRVGRAAYDKKKLLLYAIISGSRRQIDRLLRYLPTLFNTIEDFLWFKLSAIRDVPSEASSFVLNEGLASYSLEDLQVYLNKFDLSYYTKNGKDPLVYPYVLLLSIQLLPSVLYLSKESGAEGNNIDAAHISIVLADHGVFSEGSGAGKKLGLMDPYAEASSIIRQYGSTYLRLGNLQMALEYYAQAAAAVGGGQLSWTGRANVDHQRQKSLMLKQLLTELLLRDSGIYLLVGSRGAGDEGELGRFISDLKARRQFLLEAARQCQEVGLYDKSIEHQKRLGQMNGVEMLLQAVAMYKSKDPKTSDKEEMLENLFDSLCCMLMPLENKERFVKAEGIELMIIIMKQKKSAYASAIRALDFAMTNYPPVCERFVNVLGVKTVFTAFMGKTHMSKKNKKDMKAFNWRLFLGSGK